MKVGWLEMAMTPADVIMRDMEYAGLENEYGQSKPATIKS